MHAARTLSLVTPVLLGAVASADVVQVQLFGEVEFNLINRGELDPVVAGDPVEITFLVDSDSFLNSDTFNTRGYEIDQASFVMVAGPATVNLSASQPGTPYFVLRDNDPQADGFFLSYGPDLPSGLALDEQGAFDAFYAQYDVSYEGDTLDSLDILDAEGTYDFTGLTRFYFGITDGGIDVTGFLLDHATITVIPAPAGLAALLPLGLRRRRR